MKIAEQISVTITRGTYAGRTLLLDVEDYMPVEPSNYVYVEGWDCAVEIRGETVWFMVQADGSVYEGNECVGICPAQEVEYAATVARENASELLAETGMPVCACGDPGDCSEAHSV